MSHIYRMELRFDWIEIFRLPRVFNLSSFSTHCQIKFSRSDEYGPSSFPRAFAAVSNPIILRRRLLSENSSRPCRVLASSPCLPVGSRLLGSTLSIAGQTLCRRAAGSLHQLHKSTRCNKLEIKTQPCLRNNVL